MLRNRETELVEKARAGGIKLALAESCTGGMAASRITSVPGASEVLWGSFVSYTPSAKTAMLGVSPELLAEQGPVSRECAAAMAAGCLKQSGADVAASVTGLAGPDGDGSGKPVGLVYIGIAQKNGEPVVTEHHFTGTRQAIREAAAEEALEELWDYLDKNGRFYYH
jgi:PncC family amidohydrolase